MCVCILPARMSAPYAYSACWVQKTVSVGYHGNQVTDGCELPWIPISSSKFKGFKRICLAWCHTTYNPSTWEAEAGLVYPVNSKLARTLIQKENITLNILNRSNVGFCVYVCVLCVCPKADISYLIHLLSTLIIKAGFQLSPEQACTRDQLFLPPELWD